MSASEPARIAGARRFVTELLDGRRTEANTPALHSDDLLDINAGILARDDSAWLLAALADARGCAGGRLLLLLSVAAPLGEAAHAAAPLEALLPDLTGEHRTLAELHIQLRRGRR